MFKTLDPATRRLYFLLLAGFVLFGVIFTIAGAALPQIIRTFGWSYTVTGLVLAASSAGYFLSSFLPEAVKAVQRSILRRKGGWDLYLHPPRHAMVLCVDEKSQCQALAHTTIASLGPWIRAGHHSRLCPPWNHDAVSRRWTLPTGKL